MFGYLVAAPGDLTEAEYARYRACYCGLCRSIKERHGQLARMSLTYDNQGAPRAIGPDEPDL